MTINAATTAATVATALKTEGQIHVVSHCGGVSPTPASESSDLSCR